MITTAVCFTCARDMAVLKVSLLSLRRLLPDVEVTLVLEDADTDFITTEFPGCLIRRVPYTSRGNLNGVAHVKVQLEIFRELLETSGSTHLLKFDSDVVFTSLCDFGDADMTAVRTYPNHNMEVFGACYSVSAKFVTALQEYMSCPENCSYLGGNFGGQARVPEDLALWCVCHYLGFQAKALPTTSITWLHDGKAEPAPVYSVLGPHISVQRLLWRHLGRPPSRLEIDEHRVSLMQAVIPK